MLYSSAVETSRTDRYAYDVFISCSPADRAWVRRWLLPRLQEAHLRICDESDFEIGAPTLTSIERAIEQSRRTIVVLTPDWLASEWSGLEDLLVRAKDPAARKRRLLPLLLKPCELPEHLATLVHADFTAESHWSKEAARLTRDLQAVVPVRFPPSERKTHDLHQWLHWLRYRRRALRRGTLVALLAWLIVFMGLQLPPFQPRPGWQAESLAAQDLTELHSTGAALVAAGANTREGCMIVPKGMWYRRLSADTGWQESDVDNLLCIEERNPRALSDIVDLGSLPFAPNTVYVLTSQSGVLVSTDAGAHFVRHTAAPPLASDNHPALLVVTGDRQPTLWVAGQKSGLLRYLDGQWLPFDGQSPQGCAGLPSLTVRALLVTPSAILIGSDRKGLWLSEDGGASCRQVFDASGRYELRGLWKVGEATDNHYLMLARDWEIEPGGTLGTWQLLDICPRPSSCGRQTWQPEPNPLWNATTTVADVLVQRDAAGDAEWYLVTARGQIWRGDLRGAAPRRLPSITRCLLWCDAALTPVSPGTPPYLLAANRVYRYSNVVWWRRLWP